MDAVTPGRIVWYYQIGLDHPDDILPAMVYATSRCGKVDLNVFGPNGARVYNKVTFVPDVAIHEERTRPVCAFPTRAPVEAAKQPTRETTAKR